MSKLVCWALFDSETGDYMSTVRHYFADKIDIYGVGLSHYGKNTDHYVNFDLSDFSELFGGAISQTSCSKFYLNRTSLSRAHHVNRGRI